MLTFKEFSKLLESDKYKELTRLKLQLQDIDDELDDIEAGELDVSTSKEKSLRQEWKEINNKIVELEKEVRAEKESKVNEDEASEIPDEKEDDELEENETEDLDIFQTEILGILTTKYPDAEEDDIKDIVISITKKIYSKFEPEDKE